ncbi:MAG: ABC transporter permease subunit [bacterium]|nr:ABC transporter permease subunit [bacterium]MBK7047208.1 ABC transporter permease subunit [bacterium]MBK7670528.1 ABC transporter permease subunit [bacterium]
MRIDPVHALALARLDLGDVLRSRWLVFCLLLYAALAVLFLLVGLRESTVLGFTGMGRVLLSMSHALVLLLPLLALSATAQVVNRAQDEGALELLFSHPVTRDEYFAGVTLVRFGVLLVPFVGLMALVAAIGWIALDSVPAWGFLGRGLLVCSALIWAYTGCGLAVSTFVRNQAKAVMLLLGIWVASVALLDFLLIGVMLQWRLNPQSIFVLAALNPVEASRLALLSSAEPTLSVLGPVGFYLTHRIGSTSLLLLGVIWPAALGTAGWWLALRRFRRQDLT